jgi:hypothetical protein
MNIKSNGPVVQCTCGKYMDTTPFYVGPIIIYLIATCDCGISIDIDFGPEYEYDDNLPLRLEVSD